VIKYQSVMKKLQTKIRLLLFVFLTVVPFAGKAQSPQLVSYQAIIRGVDNAPLVSTPVTIVFTVRKTSTSGPTVYTETHSTSTNAFGLVNLNLGGGSTGGNFSLIDWSAGPFFLKVDVNGTEMGITQLVSTPYSLFALKSANGFSGASPNFYMENVKIGIGTKTPLSTLSVTGATVSDSAIFEVKNNNGLTVFAVYNEGVRINIDENMKASKGGFAIGGFSGVSGVKGTTQEYFRVTSDSTRLFLNNATMAKGSKGGFSIGGFTPGKAPVLNFVSLTQKNSLLGYSAGDSITLGTRNFFAGYEAGKSNKIGSQNVFIGDKAGYLNTSNTNIFIGTSAGYSNTTAFGSVIIGDNAGYYNNGFRNIFIGRQAGESNTSGYDNVNIGAFSGQEPVDGSYNTFVGTESGQFGTTGSNNAFFGHRAGYVSNGSNNVVVGDLAGSNDQMYTNPASTFSNSVFVGTSSGSKQQSGAGNTYLGTYAGRNNLTGTGNVFIGNQAGQLELGGNKLYISNTSTTTPLIYGEFSNGDPAFQKVRINGKLEIATVPVGSSSIPLYWDASAGVIMVSSSLKYKDEITNLAISLSDFMSLRPVSFTWNNLTATPGIHDFGLIAEEVNKSIPSFSLKNADGSIEGVNYHAVNILTIGVVQQQQKTIVDLENALSGSKNEINLLKEKVSANEIQMQKIIEEMTTLRELVKKQRKQ
jgi:hypothetical protein